MENYDYYSAKNGCEDTYSAVKDGTQEHLQSTHDAIAEEELFAHWNEIWLRKARKEILEFEEVVKNTSDYEDYLSLNQGITEYQVTYVKYENILNDEIKKELDSLKSHLILLTKKLVDTTNNLPLSEKKLITIADFEKLFSIKKETQRRLRERPSDPLPYRQPVTGGSIYYDLKEVNKWLENY